MLIIIILQLKIAVIHLHHHTLISKITRRAIMIHRIMAMMIKYFAIIWIRVSQWISMEIKTNWQWFLSPGDANEHDQQYDDGVKIIGYLFRNYHHNHCNTNRYNDDDKNRYQNVTTLSVWECNVRIVFGFQPFQIFQMKKKKPPRHIHPQIEWMILSLLVYHLIRLLLLP